MTLNSPIDVPSHANNKRKILHTAQPLTRVKTPLCRLIPETLLHLLSWDSKGNTCSIDNNRRSLDRRVRPESKF